MQVQIVSAIWGAAMLLILLWGIREFRLIAFEHQSASELEQEISALREEIEHVRWSYAHIVGIGLWELSQRVKGLEEKCK